MLLYITKKKHSKRDGLNETSIEFIFKTVMTNAKRYVARFQ